MSESNPPEKRTGFTIGGARLRVLALVLVTQALIIRWVADSEIARDVYLICYSIMMPTALYLVAARIFRRWLPFEDREIMLGYIVLTATIPIIGFGGLRFITEGMGFLSFFSQTQPWWVRYLGEAAKLPVLHDAAAIEGLYKGGTAVPWRAWAVPIAFWSAYLLMLSGVWMCLAAILRRVWIHQERLTFPVAALPIQMADPKDDIFRRPIFWIGLAIPLVLQSMLALREWAPWLPAFQLKAYNIAPRIFSSRPWSAMYDFQIGFYPMALGLAYFVPSSVSFSCWFFAVLSKLSYVGGAVLGLEDMGVGIARWPFKEEQAAGAWIAFGGVIMWNAFRQWRTARGATRSEGGTNAPLIGLGAAAFAAMCIVMMTGTGIPAPAAVGVALVYISYVLSGARIRAEAGGIWTFGPLRTPHDVMHAVLGVRGMDSQALVAEGHFHLIHVDVRAQSLPYLMEGFAIAEKTGIRWRTVLVWVGIGTFSALVMGWVSTLSKLYEIGAATAKANPYPINKAVIAFNEVDRLSRGGVSFNHYSVSALAFGAVLTVILAWANRLGKIGLHPVGYVMANTHTINAFIIPFFLAWLAKTLVLRFGGNRMYRRSIPFFVGIVLGDIATQAVWALIGWAFDVPIYQFLT